MTTKIRKKAGIPDKTVDPWSGGPSSTDKSREINIKKPKIKFFVSNQFSSIFRKYLKSHAFSILVTQLTGFYMSCKNTEA